jgi:hypothetical protein
MRDMMNNIHPVPAIAPVVVTDTTAQVSAIIDLQNYDSCTFVIATGTLADADATFAVTLDHGDASNLSDAAAVTAATGLVGTLALAGFTFADDGECRKVGYTGVKRYVRLTITPSANTGNAPLTAIAILHLPRIAATANPPQ